MEGEGAGGRGKMQAGLCLGAGEGKLKNRKRTAGDQEELRRGRGGVQISDRKAIEAGKGKAKHRYGRL